MTNGLTGFPSVRVQVGKEVEGRSRSGTVYLTSGPNYKVHNVGSTLDTSNVGHSPYLLGA